MMAILDNIMDPEIQASPLDFKRGSVAQLDQIGGHHHAKGKVRRRIQNQGHPDHHPGG